MEYDEQETSGWTSRDVLGQMMEILLQDGVLAAGTQELIERAVLRLQHARGMASTGGVFLALDVWLASERVVASFDPELDACEDGALILQRYAQATAGEWDPAGILVTPIVETEEGWRQGMVIASQETTIRWSFLLTARDGRETDWERSFYASVERFVHEHLQGEFSNRMCSKTCLPITCRFPP